VSNPFDSDRVARRYRSARPYYHRTALDPAATRLGISNLAGGIGPITDEGVAVGVAFDSDTAVGMMPIAHSPVC
jgi:hypothetical protein